ncbi:MAG: asparagine synthetase B [Pirellulales bacterium]
MPGICGFLSRHPSSDGPERLARLARPLELYDWYRSESHACDTASWGLARVSLGFLNTAPQPVANHDGSRWCVLDGELFDTAPLRRELTAAGCILQNGGDAELLLHGYEAEGMAFLRRLNGKFAAAIVDVAARRLTLVNDRFGMKPLYYVATPEGVHFASEIKSLLADRHGSRELNLRGIAQFFSFGQLFGEDTFVEGLVGLPAAACVAFDLSTGETETSSYWQATEARLAPRSDDAWLDEVDRRFAVAVERQSADTTALGISLSGGLDSRLILALVDHQRVPITSLSLGMAGSLDHRCAERMAELTNRRHHSHVLSHSFLHDFARHMRHMVHLTDGHYLSQCIVIPTLPIYRQLGIEVLLRGHAGELLHMGKAYNFSLDDAALAISSESQLEAWLWQHLRAYMLDAVDGPLLAAADSAEVECLARDSLAQALERASSVDPVLQRIWHLFVGERLRRETALSMVEFGSVVETRLPYLDNDLVDALLAAPPHLKLGETMQRHMLARHKPEFLDIPNANTGTRIGAGQLAQKFATLRMKVLAKLGVPGYQPYERLGLWLRRELAPLVRDLLLTERTLERGVFRPDTLRSVVRQHLDHERNHTFLLLALMIFEMGQREFIDGEAYDPTELAASGSSPAANHA